MDSTILSKVFNLHKEGKQIPSSWELSKEFGTDHLEMVGVLNSLDAREYIKLVKKSEKKFQLTAEGRPTRQTNPRSQVHRGRHSRV